MVHLIKKGSNGYYYFLDGKNVPYDIGKLSSSYPSETFVVVNDDDSTGYHNVHSRLSVMKSLHVDQKLRLPCPRCGRKNAYTKSFCSDCGARQLFNLFMKSILGTDYKRALAEYTVEKFLNTTGLDTPNESFMPMTTDGKDDPFVQAVVSGSVPRHSH